MTTLAHDHARSWVDPRSALRVAARLGLGAVLLSSTLATTGPAARVRAALAPEFSLDGVELVSENSYVIDGNLLIVAVLRNSSGHRAQPIAGLSLHTATHGSLLSEQAGVRPAYVAPGSLFTVRWQNFAAVPAGYDHYRLSVYIPADTAPAPLRSFSSIDLVPYIDELGRSCVSWKTHTSSWTALATGAAIAYDAAGRVIDIAWLSMEVGPSWTVVYACLQWTPTTWPQTSVNRWFVTMQSNNNIAPYFYYSSFDNFFVDVASTPFKADIWWLANHDITKGCSAETFCPNEPVTRGQMAAFLARALQLPAATVDYFSDDNGTIFEADINRLAEANITSGCGGGNYCPGLTITREQMAAYLDRALGLPSSATDFFTDDEASIFEANINALAAAGITSGCTATTFCPLLTVTRGQMAAFLHRALEV